MARISPEPRLLTRAEAAAYCRLSPGAFTAVCPLSPLRVGKFDRYDRVKLDAWLDGLSSDSSDSPMEHCIAQIGVRDDHANSRR